MKKIILGVFGVLALLALGGETASATTGILQITGWLTSATNAHVTVYDPVLGTHSGTYGVGSFRWKFNGAVQNCPLYCLDVFHSFSFGQSWEVDVLTIPPDPYPPYNTDQAAWIYNEYGRHNLTNVMAQGVQLALWEVGHEIDWMEEWSPTAWWTAGDQESGDFAINSVSDAAKNQATAILTDLFNDADPAEYHANYYKPVAADYGQGQIGEIPEPGILILLGTGLVSVAGASWRRRRHQ